MSEPSREDVMAERVRRELFAAVAMHAIAIQNGTHPMSAEELARRAYGVADAMVTKSGPLAP